MDPVAWIWFHALEENSMKGLNRLTHGGRLLR